MDRIEIRPGPRELPKDSLDTLRQKEPPAEIYPKEPSRPLEHPGKTRGFASSDYQDLPTQQRLANVNAERANQHLQRVQQERAADASRETAGASRDALFKLEDTVRTPAEPADRGTANRDFHAIRSDYERHFASPERGAHERVADAGRWNMRSSREALLHHENMVRTPVDQAARKDHRRQLDAKINAPDRQTSQRDIHATRADYEKYLAPEGSPANRALKREQLDKHIHSGAREVTGKELGRPVTGREII